MAIHVLPVNDIAPHTERDTCPCAPVIEYEDGEKVVIHNSWDGREEWETMTLQ
jgi:hypothetical protein